MGTFDLIPCPLTNAQWGMCAPVCLHTDVWRYRSRQIPNKPLLCEQSSCREDERANMWQMFIMLLSTALEGTRACSNGHGVRHYAAEHSWCFNMNCRWNNAVSSQWGKQDAAQLSSHAKFLSKLSIWSTMCSSVISNWRQHDRREMISVNLVQHRQNTE